MTRHIRKKPLIAIAKPMPKKNDIKPYLFVAMLLTLIILTIAGMHY